MTTTETTTQVKTSKEVVNFQTSPGITLMDIEQQINAIPLNKENAIKLMIISKLLSAREEEAKQYLLDRCADCDKYTTGQLQLLRVDASRSSYSNSEIDSLKKRIKEIEQGIKTGAIEGDKVETKYTSFRITK